MRILISLFSQPNDGYLRLKLKQDPQDLKSGKDPRLRMGSTLVLLCYKRREQQNGQHGSCWSRARAILMRRVAMDCGLCRSARARRAAGQEAGRDPRGA